jgi:NAD(P)-dependent dehydrogenase (short-subunit alcohol dehydrogenase family)
VMDKVALITGSNQGLGFALVEALCKNLGPKSSVYLTARNGTCGEEAVGQLRDRGLLPTSYLDGSTYRYATKGEWRLSINKERVSSCKKRIITLENQAKQ